MKTESWLQQALARMSLGTKLAVVLAIALVMTAIPTVLFLQRVNAEVGTAAQERRGPEPMAALAHVAHLSEELREHGTRAPAAERAKTALAVGQAFKVAQGAFEKAQASAAMNATLAALERDWRALEAEVAGGRLAEAASDRRHEAQVAGVLALLHEGLDHWALALDPEFDSYYLIDAALLRAPELGDRLSRLRMALAAEPFAPETVRPMVADARERMAGLLQSARKSMGREPRIRAGLASVVDSAARTVEAGLAQAERATAGAAAAAAAKAINDGFDALFELDRRASAMLTADLGVREDELRLQRLEALGAMAVLLVLAAAASLLIARSIVRPVAAAVAVAGRVAEGDLASVIEVRGQNEMAQLMQALARMQERLRDVVEGVRRNAESVSVAASQIAQGNGDLSQRTERQASALQESAASMEQLGAAVTHNAESARQASRLAQGASDVAGRGGAVVARVVETMKGIDEASRRIGEINGVIDGIAFQTNILALNAAVEAARAGEQGRGFAVVASEVRALAQRSTEAAREIKALIAQSAERVADGSTLAGEAGRTMVDVVEAIRRVNDLVGQISAATGEQSAGITQVGQAVGEMDQVTQQNAALVEESAAAAESLRQQAGQLVEAVAAFQLHAQPA